MILGAYGASQINIGLSVHLRDNFSGPAQQVKAAFGSLKQELSMYQNNLREARNMYGQLFAAGSIATLGMVGMVKQGARFDDTIRGVAAAAGATSTEFKQLYDLANKVGGTSMFKPEEAGKAMRELALANFDTKGIMEATEPIVNLAGASMTNLATSADIAISTMYQFNKTAADMGQITDLLTYASNKSAINLTDLGESLKYVSATGVDLGQSLPNVLSMLMVLGNAGLKGSIAGVALENMMRYMALGLGEYAKEGRAKSWEAFGLNPKDLVTAEGGLKPVADIFKAMSIASEKMGDVDKQNMLYQVFNVRGKRGASKLLQQMEQWEKYSAALAQQEGNGGFAASIMDYRMGGVTGSIERMKGAWDATVNEFTQAVTPLVKVITKVLEIASKLISAFSSTIVGKVIITWVAGTILLKTALWGVKLALSSVYLAQSQVGGTWEGVKTSMMLGWQQLIGSAQRYNSTLLATQVITNRARGFMPAGMTAANAAALGLGGYFVGGRGRVFRSMAGGGIMRTGAGTIVNRNLLPQGLGAGVGRNLWLQRTAAAGTGAMVGGRVLGGFATRLGMGSIGRALGLFGGPWGIAAMAALTLLPALFTGWGNKVDANTGAVDKNTQATDKNSSESRLALARLSDAIGTQEMQIRKLYTSAGMPAGSDYLLESRRNEYMANPNLYGERKFYDYSKPGVINVYQNGKLSETVKAELNKQVNLVLNPE